MLLFHHYDVQEEFNRLLGYEEAGTEGSVTTARAQILEFIILLLLVACMDE
jgi:hypothetical protein